LCLELRKHDKYIYTLKKRLCICYQYYSKDSKEFWGESIKYRHVSKRDTRTRHEQQRSDLSGLKATLFVFIYCCSYRRLIQIYQIKASNKTEKPVRRLMHLSSIRAAIDHQLRIVHTSNTTNEQNTV
jgi:GT2 family glycosyltransferase